MWNVMPTDIYDWRTLKKKIAKHGVRNSLLLAPMPTVSTAHILSNNESVEPFTSNVYSRRILSGNFQVVNHHLMKNLIDVDLWIDLLKNETIVDKSSVEGLEVIQSDLQPLYKTVWEIFKKTIIDVAADRSAFMDQSHSLNIHMTEPNYAKLMLMHFFSWRKELKTVVYYVQTKSAALVIHFTADKQSFKSKKRIEPSLANLFAHVNGSYGFTLVNAARNGVVDSPNTAITCALYSDRNRKILHF